MPNNHDRRGTTAVLTSALKTASVTPMTATTNATMSSVAVSAGSIPDVSTGKRFSLVHVPRHERRVTIRPYESFRERKYDKKESITFGYAALSMNDDESQKSVEFEDGRASSPSPSIFSIYGDEPGPSTICEQPVGAQADVFISSLGEKKLKQIKSFLESTPREEHMYFLWVKDSNCNKITVISIKTLENHLKNNSRVRRVKWRHLSTERVSIYRYSLPAITYEKSKMCRECLCRHKKMCLLLIWLAFVLFLCLVVVLGSLSPEDRTHPFAHYPSRNSSFVASGYQPPLTSVLMNTSIIG